MLVHAVPRVATNAVAPPCHGRLQGRVAADLALWPLPAADTLEAMYSRTDIWRIPGTEKPPCHSVAGAVVSFHILKPFG